MVLADGAVDTRLIVGSITGEGREWTCDLVEQGLNLRAIIDIAGGQLGGEDLSRLGIHADVQLAPGPAPLGAMLLDQPLAGPTEPQARAVDQQVNGPSGAWTWLWDLQGLGASAQGRVIRHRQIQAEQPED